MRQMMGRLKLTVNEEKFGVSRQMDIGGSTGIRKSVGPEGLLDRSSKPNGCSYDTTEAIENEMMFTHGRV
jgi:hypothetical protein